MHLKSAREIEIIARAGDIIARLFEELQSRVGPGVSTAKLDSFAEEFIRSYPGAIPGFKGLYGFPATLCTSINEEVVHGIPSRKRILREGDLLKVDVGVRLDGWHADAAVTFPVGEVDEEAERLMAVTREALERGVEAAALENHVGDIGAAVQKVVEDAGFSVIRELVGHAVGRNMHEDPQVPNFGSPGRGPILREGLVLAIEPMVSTGDWRVETLEDRWTVVTTDRSRTAHYEHTVAITEEGPRILTAARTETARRAVG